MLIFLISFLEKIPEGLGKKKYGAMSRNPDLLESQFMIHDGLHVTNNII